MPMQLAVTAEGAMYSASEQHRLLDVARVADEMGVEHIDVVDHVLMGLDALNQPEQGWERHHLDMVIPEPLTTLAAMVGITQRIKLVSSIVIAPLRPAGFLAKQAATLHALSRGRFIMGVSVSWQRAEYDALGVPFQRRGQVLDDTIAACRVLWTEAPATFHSETVNFDGMFCSPRPAPGERIAVWYGGFFTPRLIRRVIELGDGWLLYGGLGMSLEQKAEAIAELKEKFAAAGRDPATLGICDMVTPLDGDIARSLEQVPAMADAGINVVRMHLRRFSNSPDGVLPAVEEIVRRFEPYRGVVPGI